MTGLYALRYVYWGTEHVRYMTEDAKGFLGMLLHACFVLSLARRLVPDSELKLSAAPAARGLPSSHREAFFLRHYLPARTSVRRGRRCGMRV
jgi:hypothetical protein